jgi:hypothetical protein
MLLLPGLLSIKNHHVLLPAVLQILPDDRRSVSVIPGPWPLFSFLLFSSLFPYMNFPFHAFPSSI